MKKRTLALLLIMALCISLLAGCGNSEQVAPSGQNDDDSSTGVDAAQTAVVEDEEEMAEINIALMCLAALDRAATQPVEDAVNAITEPELNIHVTINWYDAASYGTQVPMQIQAAEKLDLIMFTPVPSASYSSFRNSNQLMDITDLLHQYGQTILATEGDLIGATSFGGSIYGIPSHYNLAGGAQVFVRRDLAEEYGVAEALENAKTWTEIHDAFMTITAGTGMPALANIDDKGTVMYLSPYFMASDDLSEAYSYDNLGDGYRMIIVDPDTNQIKNVFATDEYRETIARTRAWYEDGLIYKDAATAQVYGSSQVRADVCYAVVNAGSLGSEQTFASNTGYDPIIINLADTTLGSVTVSKLAMQYP